MQVVQYLLDFDRIFPELDSEDTYFKVVQE